MLYEHQVNAVNKVCSEDFASGIINYATGTGKSRIGFEIINQFNNKYNNLSIMWICEHKYILKELFKSREFVPKNLIVKNFTEDKPSNWVETVNQMKFWGKNIILVINRSFLTLNKKYEKLTLPFGLIIHDECHSITSDTLREFYSWVTKKYNNIKVIGLSATPITDYEPLNRVIISFNIIDAIKNKIISQPYIYHLKSNKTISFENKFEIIKQFIEKTYHKKTIVWCGTIENCDFIYSKWQEKYGNELKCFRSHSKIKIKCSSDFNLIENNAILFCANEHHEASDFYNLDGCVFIDGVKSRTEKLFVQCFGRIIRKNNNKNYSWMLDIDAVNSMELCNRLLAYAKKTNEWQIITSVSMFNDIEIHELKIEIKKEDENKYIENNIVDYSIENIDIKSYFKRQCPIQKKYVDRLKFELNMIERKDLIKYLIKAIQIQELCKNELYITRGSCGSSLLCYLLGITHVDPLKHNISFARFLHEQRDSLPDIDFDFPYNIRDTIFVKINQHFNGNIARISTIVNWQDKSATREALRQIGYHNQYSNEELNLLLNKLSYNEKKQIKKIKDELIGTKRTSMVHVGGIVFDYKENKILNSDNKLIDVLSDDKYTISEKKLFKIDILSSRSLAILKEIYPEFTGDDLCKFNPCQKTFNLIENGENVGLIIGESILVKRAFMRFKPKNFDGIAFCLSIVRPMAKLSREQLIDSKNNIVFDDDVIHLIQRVLKCDEPSADTIRRKIIKGDEEVIKDFVRHIHKKVPKNEIHEYLEIIKRVTEYGFCKAHALSYSMIVWHLAYAKANYPNKFWRAVFNHADSTYNNWVHMSEAVNAGVDIQDMELIKNNISVYSIARKKTNDALMDTMNEKEQLIHFGYWKNIFIGEFYPGCYFEKIKETENGDIYMFNGIIAAFRTPNSLKKQKKMGFYIGYDTGKYLDIIINERNYSKNNIGIKGYCKYLSIEENIFIEYNKCEIY